MNCLHAAAWWTRFRVCGAWGQGCGRPGGRKAAQVCTRLFPCHAPSAFQTIKLFYESETSRCLVCAASVELCRWS